MRVDSIRIFSNESNFQNIVIMTLKLGLIIVNLFP